jgi:carbon-monoxide dehydrogenase large subunit
LPGVVAVLTAADLKPLGLHWMPTLAGDVQAVLAEEKVLFQNQEVAFVIAEDRYIASDATELVDVEYEALPCIVDPFKSMDPDAPSCARTFRTRPRAHTARASITITSLNGQIGDKEATDAVFANADVTIKEMLVDHRTHPSPLETCQSVASFDKVKGELTLWGTFQAPHVIRTVVSLISGHPEHKIHVIAPDIGGGFGNKVGAYPGYVCSVVGSIVTGRSGQMGRGPDGKPLHYVFRPRLSHDDGTRRHQGRQDPGHARACAGRPWRLRRLRRSVEMAGRVHEYLHRLL